MVVGGPGRGGVGGRWQRHTNSQWQHETESKMKTLCIPTEWLCNPNETKQTEGSSKILLYTLDKYLYITWFGQHSILARFVFFFFLSSTCYFYTEILSCTTVCLEGRGSHMKQTAPNAQTKQAITPRTVQYYVSAGNM